MCHECLSHSQLQRIHSLMGFLNVQKAPAFQMRDPIRWLGLATETFFLLPMWDFLAHKQKDPRKKSSSLVSLASLGTTKAQNVVNVLRKNDHMAFGKSQKHLTFFPDEWDRNYPLGERAQTAEKRNGVTRSDECSAALFRIPVFLLLFYLAHPSI